MRTHPSLWVVPLAWSATVFSAHAAYARVCSVDSDCPRGYACTGTAASDDGGTTGACMASPCQTDGDCAPAFRCDIDAVTQCVGSACGPASLCQPQYDVPCSTDTDCGPGFACSGSVGSDNCGANQDAGYPYGTTKTIPCEDVPKPPFLPPPDSGFDIPPICQPGSICTSNTYSTCQSQAPSSCDVDSDCPSTWTCGCQQGGFGGGIALPPGDGAVATDPPCTKTCLAPNSDLGIFGGENGGADFVPASEGDAGAAEGTGTTSPSGASPTTAAGSPHANTSQGGCAVGGEDGGADWLWAPMGGLLAAWRRRSRKPAASPSRGERHRSR